MKRSLALCILLQFVKCVSSFAPSSLARLPDQWNEITLPSLRASGSDDSDTNLSPSEEGSNSDGVGREVKRKMKPTSARIGGRRKKARVTKEVPTKANSSSSNSSFLSKFRTPALIALLLLLVRGFFFADDTSTYYYSYSSTVYETRTYDSGGEVKTSRSESRTFKSNIPGMERDTKFDRMFGDDGDDENYEEGYY